MGTALSVSRLQKRGQVTIPIEIRQRLGLEEGDMVAFVETSEGIVISPQEMLPAETLNQMASYLQEKGVALREFFEFTDRMGRGEGTEVEPDPSAQGVAKRTAGIFQRSGQKPADFKAQRREFIEGTARKAHAKTNQSAE
jgi:AbrB family looped-hinge helix DNA binding protein